MPRMFEHVYRPFQSGALADAAAVASLETAAGGRLPEDYRSFLLKCNGGSLRPFAFDLQVPHSDFLESVHALNYLYELREINRRSQFGIEPALRNIPPGRIAIGTTDSELAITLNISADRHGQIEAWVRDTFNVWGEGGNTTIVYVAPSFTAFLDLLHDSAEVYSSFWASFGREGEVARKVELP